MRARRSRRQADLLKAALDETATPAKADTLPSPKYTLDRSLSSIARRRVKAVSGVPSSAVSRQVSAILTADR